MTTYTIFRISAVKLASIAAIIYGILGLLVSPVIIFSLWMEGLSSGMLMIFAIFGSAVGYALLGFVIVAIAIGLFNLVAPRLGGVEVEVE